MGIFDEIERLIVEKTGYNPDTRENESTYLQFKDEINAHIAGELAFDQLSPIAQDTIREWESIINARLTYYEGHGHV